jgi:hypothetical protein
LTQTITPNQEIDSNNPVLSPLKIQNGEADQERIERLAAEEQRPDVTREGEVYKLALLSVGVSHDTVLASIYQSTNQGTPILLEHASMLQIRHRAIKLARREVSRLCESSNLLQG